MNSPHLTPRALASRWDIRPCTLSQWRWNGKGPLFMKIGGRVLYRAEDIEAFEFQHYRRNTCKEGFVSPNTLPTDLSQGGSYDR